MYAVRPSRLLLIRRDKVHDRARCLDIVRVRGCEARLVLRESQRDDREAGDARMGLYVIKRRPQFVTVVQAGAQDDLGMHLDSSFEKALEHLHPAGGVAPDQAAAHLGARRRAGRRSSGTASSR